MLRTLPDFPTPSTFSVLTARLIHSMAMLIQAGGVASKMNSDTAHSANPVYRHGCMADLRGAEEEGG